jgi:hypothetical protein
MHQELIDFDELFVSLATPPLIANDFDIWTSEGKQRFRSLLMTEYDGDFSSPVPKCRCLALKGGKDYGITCSVCGTKCLEDVERDIESTMWLRPPEGVHRFVHPAAWRIVSRWLTVKSVSILQYITDPTLKVPEHLPWVEKYAATGLPRGLNAFYENFEPMVEAAVRIVPNKTQAQRREMMEFIRFAKDRFFCKHLPIPNQVAFIVEKNDYGRFADVSGMTDALNAIFDVVSAEGKRGEGLVTKSVTTARKEHTTVRAMNDLTSYYRYFVADICGVKEGLWRQNIFGTMLHFTARGVITSISEPHHYQECHLPWSMSVQLFRAHLLGKLLRGSLDRVPMSYNQAHRLLTFAVSNYVEVINELFLELIAESPYPGIPITLQRNPSLMRGSAQLLYVPVIGTDPDCNTIRLSVLVLSAPGADFDGDAMNVYLIVDKFMHDLLERLAPKYGAMDLNAPLQYSSSLNVPAPTVSCIGAWMREEENEFGHLMESD